MKWSVQLSSLLYISLGSFELSSRLVHGRYDSILTRCCLDFDSGTGPSGSSTTIPSSTHLQRPPLLSLLLYREFLPSSLSSCYQADFVRYRDTWRRLERGTVPRTSPLAETNLSSPRSLPFLPSALHSRSSFISALHHPTSSSSPTR